MQFTEEQEMLREAIRDFVRREIPPGFAREMDERAETPMGLYRKFADAGFMGVGIPDEFGGSGGGMVEIAIVLLELARGFQSLSHMVYRSMLFAAQAMLSYGTDEQKKTFLPAIASGDSTFCFSLSEAQAGSDAASIQLRAERDGDEFVLNGEKMWNSGAGYADYVVLATRTSKEGRKHDGITLFLVDLHSEGITKSRIPTLGDRPVGTFIVNYDEVRVPGANMLGELNGGWRCLMTNLAKERFSTAPICVGVAESILARATEYVNNRVQFGQPIGKFQAIQHQLADVAVDVHISHLLTWDTARKLERGLSCRRESAIAKLYTSEMLNRAAYAGMQVMGGIGYTTDEDMSMHYRNARFLTIGAGSSEVMRNVIARDIGVGVS
jgi:alkylation response protein AidB-like acyl-CoA dehydrogenase